MDIKCQKKDRRKKMDPQELGHLNCNLREDHCKTQFNWSAPYLISIKFDIY